MSTTLVDDPSSESPPRGRRSRLRVAFSVAGPLAILGVLGYLLASRGDQISAAARRMSFLQLVLVTLLALVTMLARTEAVVACLSAMGSPPSRRDIHAANSLTMLAAMLNHYISSFVRATLVRRIDPHRAPTTPQMIMVDVSAFLIEGLLVSLLIIVSAGSLKLAWWVPTLVVLGGICALIVALVLRHRFADHPVVRGLDMLVHSRLRTVVAGLMTLVIICQVLRTLVVLDAVGLNPSLLQAVATFVAAGVLSTLFAGPGAGAAGAPLIVFGHNSVAASAAAGLVLSGTALLAGTIYSLLGGPLFLWRMRQAAT